MRSLFFASVTAACFLCSACSGPRARLGYIPTNTFAVTFADPQNIGPHGYRYSFFEKSGILYTCNGGHLDLDHVRGAADQTRYRIEQIRKMLTAGRQTLNFSLAGERSEHRVRLTYPADWNTRSDKQAVIDEIAFSAGPYFAYSATVWHEIITWFGARFMLIEPEFNSAFSWEDLYSNVLGIHLALEALHDTSHDYDQAMTLAIDRALKRLNVQPRSVAIAASDSVRGTWYTGNLVPDVKMRNFDIGIDGSVTPTLVPNIAQCPDPKPEPLSVLTLDALRQFGFRIDYEIKPNMLNQGAIFQAAGQDQILPERDFAVILDAIKKQAAQMAYTFDE